MTVAVDSGRSCRGADQHDDPLWSVPSAQAQAPPAPHTPKRGLKHAPEVRGVAEHAARPPTHWVTPVV